MTSTALSYSFKIFLNLVLLSHCLFCGAVEVSYDGRALKIDGERRIIISGSIHYPRSTPEMWPSLIRKSKEGGLNGIDTYVFWNAHEPVYREYDFSGNLDLIQFLKNIQAEGLYAFLRIGPYICAEWNYGGFPVWLHNMAPNMTFRTKNDVFMNEMRNFVTLIVDMVRQENLFAPQGGPVILAQIENEYGPVAKYYGEDGRSYINWSAKLAESLNIGVPWFMCGDEQAPEPMINTCNSFYGCPFYPNDPNPTKLWTENWVGWVRKWGDRYVSVRPVEETAFAVAHYFQYGGTTQTYYMYHGGTNFGRSAGPYVLTSYDFDAPLDEYGNLNQPIWGHLKQLHLLLRSMEKILTYGVPTNIDYGNNVTATIFSLNEKRVCFFGSLNDTKDIAIKFEGNNYTIPAWSVSILPDCHTLVYNTAQVNAQTGVMVKKTTQELNEKLEWTWRNDRIEQIDSSSKGLFSANKLLEQKAVTNDTSDYLWYMTSVEIEEKDLISGEEFTLQVHTKGHVLHVFVNGKHIGTEFSRITSNYTFGFETNITLKHGKNNSISLLSSTVGLENYGGHFDTRPQGILGPVKLVSRGNEEKDLSNNRWVYKTGLDGFNKRLYKHGTHHRRKWLPEHLPSNQTLVWYKTTFKTPPGEEAVVLDLTGLGKGIAWVNGHNIGRYWASIFAGKNGCENPCDYRGVFYIWKCVKNCGVPSQRWYHVPRSFLRDDDDNSLILFEEFGGSPLHVKVQTVTLGKVCAKVYEGNMVELSCQGDQVITDIKFGSFGDPKGTCGSFKMGSCESPVSLSVIKEACVGKKSCFIDASKRTFGYTGCREDQKHILAVEAIC